MFLSRIYPLVKLSNFSSKRVVQSIRHSHVCAYRIRTADPHKSLVWTAEIVQGIAWWWVLWHLWTEPDHITGEFEYPDPSKWTDEELGIPSD